MRAVRRTPLHAKPRRVQRSLTTSLLLISAGLAAASLLLGVTPAGADTTSTTTTVSVTTPGPYTAGESVTYTASVVGSDSSTPPDGESVTFSDGTTSCTGTLSAGTASSCAFTATGGTDTVTAGYGGDSSYGASSGLTSITVNTAATTTKVSATTPGPYTYGESVSYSASVVGSDSSKPPDGESVTFSNGTTSCTGTLSGGTATSCAFTATVGTDTVTASYGGDSNYSSSSGSTSITVSRTTTTTTVSVTTPGPYTYGESVSYSASVVGSDSSNPPDGESVTFSDGKTSCTGNLSGGKASSCAFTATGGTDTVTASYGGDSNYSSSSGSTSITVSRTTTTTTVSVMTPGPYTYGESVSYSASVVGSNSSNLPDGESVTFSDGKTSCTRTLSGGIASSCAFTATVGTDTVTASYGGDSNYSPSSGSTSITVNPATSTTTVSVTTPGPYTYGEAVRYSASVVGSNSSNPPDGESVTFSDGTTSCTGTLSGGTATSCTFTATLGTDTVTASYGGDSNYSPSSGSTSITVGQATTKTSVSVSGPTTTFSYGEALDYDVTVTVSSPGTFKASPSGSVDVEVNGTALCTASLVAGSKTTSATGSCSSTDAPSGSDAVTADYGGDTNFLSYSPSSSQDTVDVGTARTTISISVSQTSVPYGSFVAYSVTVNPKYPWTPSASGSPSDYPAGEFTVTVGGTAVCTASLESGELTGTCDVATAPLGTDQTIGASWGDPPDFASPSAIVSSQTLTVTVAPQTITFAPPTSATVGGTAALSATGGGSGNPVVFSVDPASGPEVCGVSGNDGAVVRFFSEGMCVIDANQAGNADYDAALEVSQGISVTVSNTGGGGGGSAPSIALLPNAGPPSGLPSADFGTPISWVVGSGSATTIEVPIGAAKVTVTIPTGALPTNTTVSFYPLERSSPVASSLPAGKSDLVSFALSWEEPGGSVPVASDPISVTIVDPRILSGDVVYQVTTAGLRAFGAAGKNGTLTLKFSDDPAVLIASNPRVSVAGPLVVTRGTLPLTLDCSNVGCSGSAVVDGQVVVPSKSGSRIKAAKKEVLLARGSFKFGKLKRLTLHLSLGALGKSLLAGAKIRPVVAVLKISVRGGSGITRTVSIH